MGMGVRLEMGMAMEMEMGLQMGMVVGMVVGEKGAERVWVVGRWMRYVCMYIMLLYLTLPTLPYLTLGLGG